MEIAALIFSILSVIVGIIRIIIEVVKLRNAHKKEAPATTPKS